MVEARQGVSELDFADVRWTGARGASFSACSIESNVVPNRRARSTAMFGDIPRSDYERAIRGNNQHRFTPLPSVPQPQINA